MTKSESGKVIMAGIDKVNDSEIELILMADDDSFIPMFWAHNRKLSPLFNFISRNHANYLWGFDNAHNARYSLLFVCYLLNHLLCPVCWDPEEKQLSVTWIDNASRMKTNRRHFTTFILDNLEEYIKIKELLDEKKKKLLPHEMLHSSLDEIPMSLHKELSNDKCCVCRVSQRGYQCRNCIHHNMILLEIIHRPKCWKSFTPDVYISTPINLGPMREYIYYIDLKNGIATMGWESCGVVYNTRLQHREKYTPIQQCKKVPLQWSILEIFKNCEARQKVPTLLDCTTLFIINTFGVEKIKKEIHLSNLIKEHLHKVYLNIVKYTPMFNPF